MDIIVDEAKKQILAGLGDGKSVVFTVPDGASNDLKAFYSRIPDFDEKTVKGLYDKSIQTEEVHYYGSNTLNNTDNTMTELFEEDASVRAGVTNLDSSKVPANRPFVMTKITLEYSATDVKATKDFTLAAAPAELGGDVEVKAGDNVLFKVPVSLFEKVNENQNVYMYQVKTPKKVEQGEILKVNVKINQALTGASHSLRATLSGIGIKSNKG